MLWSELFEDSDFLDSHPETAPNIIVFIGLGDHPERLKNVDYVVDASPFDVQSLRHFVQLHDLSLPAFEVLDELPAELLQAFFLPVVGEDLLAHFLLGGGAGSAWLATAHLYAEGGQTLFEEQGNEGGGFGGEGRAGAAAAGGVTALVAEQAGTLHPI